MKDHTARRFAACLVAAAAIMSCIPAARAAEGEASLRRFAVELPGQESNVIKESWPGIGCWFWTSRELAPDGYRDFIDKAEKYSAFGLLTTSIRASVEVTDTKVHDQIKLAAQYEIGRAHV